VGHTQDFLNSSQRTATSVKNLVLHNVIHYCTCKHFPMLCIWSIDGSSVVHSWRPYAINIPVAQFFKIFFSNSYR
jgi:hypothetical protein